MTARVTRKPRRWPFALFMAFLLGYNLFRVALFAATQSGAITTDRPLDPAANAIIVYSELAIGLFGLAAIPGLVRSKAWAFWATVAVNAYAIVFDAAAAVGVQLSAAGGMAPPAVILLLLLVLRLRFFAAEPGAARSSAVQA